MDDHWTDEYCIQYSTKSTSSTTTTWGTTKIPTIEANELIAYAKIRLNGAIQQKV